ncbi:MAG: hypothetical protein Q8922_03685 [Bacteroidota bacterium]|nr:hypothetical protein [Bacteroidota bacterium]
MTTSLRATPVDSGKCPWKLPFTLRGTFLVEQQLLHVGFNSTTGQCYEADPWVADSVLVGIGVTVDTTLKGASLVIRGDTLRYQRQIGYSGEFDSGGEDFRVWIVFAPNSDSIRTLQFSVDSSGESFQYHADWSYSGSAFLFGLTYDSASIQCPQLGVGQMLSLQCEKRYCHHIGPGDGHKSTLLGTYSADLSGIFPPTHLTNGTSAVREVTQLRSLSIRSLGGSIECAFASSPNPRTLEVFTPLGVRITEQSIAVGETSATIPRLPSGLYFIHMEGALVKVFVSE